MSVLRAGGSLYLSDRPTNVRTHQFIRRMIRTSRRRSPYSWPNGPLDPSKTHDRQRRDSVYSIPESLALFSSTIETVLLRLQESIGDLARSKAPIR